MSQSAASGALKDLEKQFDIQLFDRIGKRLHANEMAKLIRPKAQALVERAHDLEQELLKHKEVGPIRVGATLTIGNYLAVSLMSQYMEQYEGAHVNLEVDNTENIAEKILNFDLDIALVEGELQHSDLNIIPWRDDRLVVFCAADHPLAATPLLHDEDLLQIDWILREPGSGTRQTFDWAMHGISPQLNILLELQHTEAIKRAVESGLGVSCLSFITVVDEFRRKTLVPLKVPHRSLTRKFFCVWHKEKFLSAGILQWMKICGIEPPESKQ